MKRWEVKEGFYMVRNAPRWSSWSHDSRAYFDSGINEFKEFEGKIGFLDMRMMAMRDPRNTDNSRAASMTSFIGGFHTGITGSMAALGDAYEPYNIPLIFRSEVVSLGGRNRNYAASFFKEDEIFHIPRDVAARKMHKLVLRKYEDLEDIPERINGLPLVRVDYGVVNENFSLESIPICMPFTSESEAQERIESDRSYAIKMNSLFPSGSIVWTPLHSNTA